MTAGRLYIDKAPSRDSALPFVYTAPVALVVAGMLLAWWGPLALMTPWSAPTLALTHVATLGVLSMLAVGVFVPLVAVAGNAEVPRPMTAHVVYYALLLGVSGLTWGTAHAQAGPVFAAIGAIGVMGVVFIGHGVVCLRRAASGGPTVRALRTALWSFFLAASLGVWLAHGHGGMQFPGPRGLWLTVHLSVALLGWIGGMWVAVSAEVMSPMLGGAEVDARALTWIDRGIRIGVTLPTIIVLAQYFGALPADASWLAGLTAVTLAPALIAVWVAHPLAVLRALAGAPDTAGLRFVRMGLALAPVAGVAALAAALADEPRMGILFGWLAIFGWAGSCFCAVLVVVLPRLLSPPATPSAEQRVDGLLRRGLVLYVAALAVGVSAILAPSAAVAARFTGGLVVVEGVLLLVAVARVRRSKQAAVG